MAASHAGAVPLTWRCGVDNNFGWLTGPHGEQRLCELHVIWFVETAELVCLHTGQRLSIPADGTWTWEPIKPAEACALVGIPAPDVDGRAELDRRLDPFHVERRRSPLFAAVSHMIRSRPLPVGHALRTVAAGERWDGHWDGADYHSPEEFAAAANRHATACPDLAAATIVSHLLAEDLQDLDRHERVRVLARHGWDAAVEQLDAAIAEHAERIPPLEPPARVAVQLALTI